MKHECTKLMKSALFCICLCILLAFGIALLLRSPLFIGFRAYLYRLLLLDILCFAVLLVIIVAAWIWKKQIFGLSLHTAVLCLGMSTLFIALFLSLGPMPIERSYTIYSLAEMTDSDQEIRSAEEIKMQFIDGYIEEANESRKRIDEQVSIGNLEEVGGGYRITDKGKALIKLMRLIEWAFPVPDETCIYPYGNEK